MPLIKAVNALDKTASQLAAEIETAYLDGYLVEPNVNVVIERFRPFFIKGAVKNVGAYDFQFDLSVDEAISAALLGVEDSTVILSISVLLNLVTLNRFSSLSVA